MQRNWITERFPGHADELRQLTDEHRLLEDEPLHLAVAYDPRHDPNDVFLFEVVGGFAGGAPNPDRNLFEVTYGASSEFASVNGEHLHLILTSPEELPVAIRERWPLAVELAEAVRTGNFEVLFEDETGSRLLELLRE